MDAPEPRYTRSGEYHLAYQTLGDGPLDLVFLVSVLTQGEAAWEAWGEWFTRLASFGRLILFDRRGIGFSDPVPSWTGSTLEEWSDDLRAILDTLGSERAALLAFADAGALAMLFASTYPERVSALVLGECYARLERAEDYPSGIPQRLLDPMIAHMREQWGTGSALEWVAPERAGDERVRSLFAKMERQTASPGTYAAMRRMLMEIDVRHVLPSIRCPTLVMHRKDARGVRVGHGLYLVEHIPGATYVELPGSDQAYIDIEDRDEILDEIEEFLTGVRPVPQVDRVLATVLFTDVVDSTKHAAERGDRAWRDLLERHRQVVRRQLERNRGREVNTTGDGFLATFDGPARAIQCANAIVQGSRTLGVEIRAGLHTGEIELLGDDIGGIAVHIGARVSALAGAGEVLVSSTVKDLVAGSGIEFEDRGAHELKGVPGEWRLYAVQS